jgi:hypothetical protein
MGHSSTWAALVYLHGSDARQRVIADGLSKLVEREMRSTDQEHQKRSRKQRRARGGTVAKTKAVVSPDERGYMRADLGCWLVGVPGLEPGTSSLSGCRRSGSDNSLASVSWAYVRIARFSYLAMSCACTRGPRRSRATVGPTLGPGTFRSVGMGKASRTVQVGPCAVSMFQACCLRIACCPAVWQQCWQQSG